MLLVETLEELVYHYLEDPPGPGSAVGKVNGQDLVSHLVQHLAECGVDVGFKTATGGDQPWKYYDLGDGYCTYDYFGKCLH